MRVEGWIRQNPCANICSNRPSTLTDGTAELNLLKVPPQEEMPDLDVLLLLDVLSTAWHATEMGEVFKGDTVAIWGAG